MEEWCLFIDCKSCIYALLVIFEYIVVYRVFTNVRKVTKSSGLHEAKLRHMCVLTMLDIYVEVMALMICGDFRPCD